MAYTQNNRHLRSLDNRAEVGSSLPVSAFIPLSVAAGPGLEDSGDMPDDLGTVTPVGKMVEQTEASRNAVTSALLDLEHYPHKRKRLDEGRDAEVGSRSGKSAYGGGVPELELEMREAIFSL